MKLLLQSWGFALTRGAKVLTVQPPRLTSLLAAALFLSGATAGIKAAPAGYTLRPANIKATLKLQWPASAAPGSVDAWLTANPGEKAIASGSMTANSAQNGDVWPSPSGSYSGEIMSPDRVGGVSGPVMAPTPGATSFDAVFCIPVQTGVNGAGGTPDPSAPGSVPLPYRIPTGSINLGSRKYFGWPIWNDHEHVAPIDATVNGPCPGPPGCPGSDPCQSVAIPIDVAAIRVRLVCGGVVQRVESFNCWAAAVGYFSQWGYYSSGPEYADQTFLVPANETFSILAGSYTIGTDPASDTFFGGGSRGPLGPFAPGHVETIDFEIPCAGSTNVCASATGRVDMVGRHEIPFTGVTHISASGPNFGRYATFVPLGSSPSSGNYQLINMLPGPVTMGSLMYLRGEAQVAIPAGRISPGPAVNPSDRVLPFFEDFTSPTASATLTCPGPTDFGDLLHLNPWLMHGAIMFRGPVDCPEILQGLIRYQDANFVDDATVAHDGVLHPAFSLRGSPVSHIETSGGQSAGHPIGNGQAAVSFPGYYPNPSTFSGYYQVSLAGIDSQPSTWTGSDLRLFFVTSPTTRESLTLARPDRPPVTVAAGGKVVQDHEYCFSSVKVEVRNNTAFTTLSSSVSGSFSGVDSFGKTATYIVDAEGGGALEAPVVMGASPNGVVPLLIPEGNYVLQSGVTYPNGSSQSLPNIHFAVGCRQCLKVTPGGPTIAVSNVPPCVNLDSLENGVYPLSGRAQVGMVSSATLALAKYSVNGGPDQVLCSGAACGTSFAFTALPVLVPGLNTIVITTVDSDGLSATTTITITADGGPPVITGCTDITVTQDPGVAGAMVNYVVNATDDSGTATLVCVPPPGLFPIGSTLVTCTATDPCGNSTNCSFTVTVVSDCVEIIEEQFGCPGTNGIDSYRFCVRNRSGHDLGYLTLVGLPSGVSATPYFIPLVPPLPGGQTRCVTVALSGVGAHTNLCFRLMAHSPDFADCCIIDHCVAIAPTPTRIVCPEDITVPCASNGGAFVSYPLPTVVTGSCPVASVICTPPSASFYPTGVHRVDCVVTDARGAAASCSFLVHVVPNEICDCSAGELVLCAAAENTARNAVDGSFGTLFGGAGYAAGKIGRAFALNGPGDQVLFAHTGPLLLNASFSFEAWVNPATLNNHPVVFEKGFGVPNRVGLEVLSDGRVCGYIDGTTCTTYTGPGEVTANAWTHLAFVYDCAAGQALVYVNGALKSSLPAPSRPVGSTAPLRLGGSSVFAGYEWSGLIDEVSLYTRALSAAEVAAHAASTTSQCAPCANNVPGLVAWWRGETNALDSAGPSHGVLRNGAAYAPGKVGEAFQFDGIDDYVEIGSPAPVQLTSAITLEAWVNTDTMVNGQVAAVISKWQQVAMDDCYGLNLVKQSGIVRVACGIGNGTTDLGLIGGSFSENTWTHVAATYDAVTQMRHVFVNGVLVGSGFRTRFPSGGIVSTPTVRLLLGREDSYLPRPFKGRIDEASLYNRALAECEIFAIYQAGAGGKCAVQLSPNCPPCTNALHLVCPSDIEVANDPGLCSALVQYVPPAATGGCSSNVSVTCTPPSGVFQVGTNTVTCTATNGAGQSAQCSFRVIVRDLEPPVVACLPSLIVTNCLLPQLALSASDNCTASNQLVFTQFPPGGTPMGAGTTVVITRVCDLAGNCYDCDTVVTLLAPRDKYLTLYSGTDAAGGLLSAGSTETRLQNIGGPVAGPFVAVSSNSLPALWVNNSGKSTWIAPPQLNGPVGYYTNRWQFDLPCTNATITGRFATDDQGFLVLNGTLVAGPTTPFVWNNVNLTAGFLPGLNTLDIVAFNSGGGPVGLRAELNVWTECCDACVMTQVCVAVPADPAHWYTGGSERDLVGRAPGTLEPGVTIVPGKIGNAMHFNGSSGGMNLGNVPDLDFGHDDSFTIEAWFNSRGPTALPNDGQIIVSLNYECSNQAQNLGIDWLSPAPFVYFFIRDEFGNNPGTLVSPVITPNVWHHVAAVRDRSVNPPQVRLYLDCELVDVKTDITTGSLARDCADFIGRRNTCTTENVFNGEVDEVTFYKRALSGLEIRRIAGAMKGKCRPDCAPLPSCAVALWKAEHNAKESINGIHGKSFNGAAYAPGASGRAWSFDGVNDYVSAAVPAASPLNVVNDLTLCAWVSADATPAVPAVIAGRPLGYQLDLMPTRQVRFAITTGPGVFENVDTPFALPANRFTFVAGTYHRASGVMNLYVDCALVASKTLPAGTALYHRPNSPFQVGGFNDPTIPFTGSFLRGRVDDVGVFSCALTAAEIGARCSSGEVGWCKRAKMFIEPAGNGNLIIEWDNASGTLQRASTPGGPWTEVPGAEGSLEVIPNGATSFFRIREMPE